MLKLLQINSVVNIGSSGRIAEQIGCFAIDQGWESYIAFGKSVNNSTSITIKIGSIIDHAFHVFQSRLFDRHGLGSIKATNLLISDIQNIKPDIIHLHNIHGYYINYRILFEYLANSGISVVWTLHDCWAFTGHCCYFERVQCQKWKSECYRCPLKWLYPQSYLFDNSKNNFLLKKNLFNLPKNLFLVTVSDWLQKQVNHSFLKNIPIQTIYNGVDLSVFYLKNSDRLKAKYGYSGKQIILGVANIWTEGKGYNTFLELSKFLNQNQIIILIGVSKKQKENLPVNIKGVERTNNTDNLADYYNMSDVFINPSMAETFGMVTAEAMACGTPSVVYDSTAMPELITEDTGFIVPLNDFKSLIDKMNIILSGDKTVYIDNCRNRAENLFDKNKQYSKYFALYNNLLHLHKVY